jgi:hypothetical protein
VSRSGYTDDFDDDHGALAMWRGRVASAIRGRRGQAFFVKLVAALDAMPIKALIADELTDGADRCALGVAMGSDAKALSLDPESHDEIGAALDISPCLVKEVEYENDDYRSETPEQRWTRMRAWAVSQIKGGAK